LHRRSIKHGDTRLFQMQRPATHPNAKVWRSSVDTKQVNALPPLCKGASRHHLPMRLTKTRHTQLVEHEATQVDIDAAESIGRNLLGNTAEQWAVKVFELADTSESGYICPAEFTAFVSSFTKQLGPGAPFRLGCNVQFTAADTSLEGRISLTEFTEWTNIVLKTFGMQRCVMAAARYLGMREAEAMRRKRVKTVELYKGFNADASLSLLKSCLSHSSPMLYDGVMSALEAKADPNAALHDPFHNGYTALICLAMTPPTVDGAQAAKSIDALVERGADPFRESGWMPFGKWTPLRFGAFMQNETVLNCLLKHCDEGDWWIGNRFLWAASENVGYIMLQELRKEFGDELVFQVHRMSDFDILATVLLQQYASPIAPGNLWALGAKQLLAGEFQSGSLPRGRKADPNGPALEGITALMNIVMQGELESAKALLLGRADPNLQDSSGAAALHHAACRLQVDMVRTLLNFNANPWQVDHAGLTPWMLVGEEHAHVRIHACRYAPAPEGQRGNPDKRRELLELLRPPISPEDIISKLQEDWQQVVDPKFLGQREVDLESLMRRFRLHESLFFSSVLADGHGAHEGRRERIELLEPMADIIVNLLRTQKLEGKQKILTRYLLLATMGPSQTSCAHIRTNWPTRDNRASYRSNLMQVAKSMLDTYAAECNQMRTRIDFMAKTRPESFCGALAKLPADKVLIPDAWVRRSHPDHARWREAATRNMLRFDPPWALDVLESPARCCMALLRLGAIRDIAGYSALVQVQHAPMAEAFARGYVKYSELCNVPFQNKMKEIAARAAAKWGLNVDIPEKPVPAKKLKRLMEKVREKKDELVEEGITHWPGLSEGYFAQSQAFFILDTVRLAFTCNGETSEKQVECCMRLFEEFKMCTPEQDKACILRLKNGFAEGVHGAGGYADVKLLVYADLGMHESFDGTQIPLQIVGEVQIILKGYMDVKHKMHLVYEVNRGSFDHKKKGD